MRQFNVVVLTTALGGCEYAGIFQRDDRALRRAMELCGEYGIEYPDDAKTDLDLWGLGYSENGYGVFIKESDVVWDVS